MEKNKPFLPIKECRLCNSNNLEDFLNLGEIPLGNNLQTDINKAISCSAYPLKIKRCNNCDHFQLSVSVDPELLYAKNYTYLSSIGASFVSHLEEYANWACKRFSLKENTLVIDIGSNDGTCLKFFKDKRCNVLGVDPASVPSEIANNKGIKTINAFFNKRIAENILNDYGQADLITSHNALAHVENLQNVFSNIYYLLKEEGYFVFEVGYFKNVLETGCFDTTYHEHIDYHHANPLAKYLYSIGFSIIGIENNHVQGGSLRFILQKMKYPQISEDVKAFLREEKISVLYRNKFLNNWENQIITSMKSLELLIKEKHNKEFSIAAYGAPTKASLLLSIANLDSNQISFIVEDNALKIGRYLPKTAIPIVNMKTLIKNKPDYILILAWNFTEDILEKLRVNIDWSLKCIVPLPKLRIVEL